MSGVALASGYARRLVELEARRSGRALKESIPTVARRLKTSHNSVFGLLFKLPKRVDFELYCALQDAVVEDLGREIGKLQNEIARINSGQIRRTPSEVAEIEADYADLKARLDRRRAADGVRP